MYLHLLDIRCEGRAGLEHAYQAVDLSLLMRSMYILLTCKRQSIDGDQVLRHHIGAECQRKDFSIALTKNVGYLLQHLHNYLTCVAHLRSEEISDHRTCCQETPGLIARDSLSTMYQARSAASTLP